MRLNRWMVIASTSFFSHRTLAHLSLAELQPISGFSDACTQAYETPLTDCSLSDFYEGNPCSPQCVAFLEAMTTRLNNECSGTTALRNTLIGMFFKQTAIQQLCAGVEVTTVSVDGADSLETATAESTSATSSPSSSKTTSTTMVETATNTVTSTTPSAVPSTISSTQTPVDPLSTGNAGQGSDDGSSTASAGESSATSPSATQGSTSTDSNNGSGGGGDNDGTGGTVLEAASTGNIRSMHGLLLIAGCLLLPMWAL